MNAHFSAAALFFVLYVKDWGAALLGLVWIAGRILYIRGYTESPEKRHKGFFADGRIRRAVHRRTYWYCMARDEWWIKLPADRYSAALTFGDPIAAFTRGNTCSAKSCIERLASAGSTQSMPA
jgi:hypothetical protein